LTLPSPRKLPTNPPVAVLAPGLRLVRVHGPGRRWNAGRDWGPHPEGRFDHHVPPPGSSSGRTVWYASGSLVGAVAESFGKRGFLDPAAGDRIVVARVVASIALVDLVGIAPRRFGLTQEIAATTDYRRTQAWARALYDAYPEPVGIRWRGRQAGSICVVLTDRLPKRSLTLDFDALVSDPRVWPRVARAAHRCGVQII
jgi:RES domain